MRLLFGTDGLNQNCPIVFRMLSYCDGCVRVRKRSEDGIDGKFRDRYSLKIKTMAFGKSIKEVRNLSVPMGQIGDNIAYASPMLVYLKASGKMPIIRCGTANSIQEQRKCNDEQLGSNPSSQDYPHIPEINKSGKC